MLGKLFIDEATLNMADGCEGFAEQIINLIRKEGLDWNLTIETETSFEPPGVWVTWQYIRPKERRIVRD